MDISDAHKTVKKAAAALTVKKEAAQAALERQQEHVRALMDGEASAQAARDPALLAEVQSALRDAQGQLALQEEVLSKVDSDLQETLQDLEGMKGLKSQGERARLQGQVAQLSGADPFELSATDRALNNVRGNIGELEARVKLHAELNPRPPAPDPEARDAALRAELAALKAARGRAPAPGVSKTLDAPTEAEPAPKTTRPKRTL